MDGLAALSTVLPVLGDTTFNICMTTGLTGTTLPPSSGE